MPKLFLIRHAIAEDRDVFKKTNQPDSERPLTTDGQKRMKKIAKKLHALEPDIEVIAQSPFTRSQQTAEILSQYYKRSSLREFEELKPTTKHNDLIKRLQPLQGKNVALVGHEPHLTQFLSYLLTGQPKPNVYNLKKGGIACLEYTTFEPEKLKLLWLATPKLLL